MERTISCGWIARFCVIIWLYSFILIIKVHQILLNTNVCKIAVYLDVERNIKAKDNILREDIKFFLYKKTEIKINESIVNRRPRKVSINEPLSSQNLKNNLKELH